SPETCILETEFSLLKADLHIHTKYSMDCETTLEEIIARCKELGINCIAVADHGTAEGGLKMKEIAPFKVIVAEEVMTDKGEIMGMFLNKTVPSGQPIGDVIAQIKEQGGLVCAQHPFDTLVRPGLGEKVMNEIAGKIDLVEVFNARSPIPLCSEKSLKFAEEHNLPGSAGSDAHYLSEIGNAVIEMPEFDDKESFLKSLREGKIDGHPASLLVHFNRFARFLRKGH
ncbi:MAG: PHP domain-containing protein, partial [Candidatus Dadabacteria bacterium]|nr:PHP domain-containing protein [Candidatus Dadabacteria bacterium]